jgi:hypothetical protein
MTHQIVLSEIDTEGNWQLKYQVFWVNFLDHMMLMQKECVPGEFQKLFHTELEKFQGTYKVESDLLGSREILIFPDIHTCTMFVVTWS